MADVDVKVLQLRDEESGRGAGEGGEREGGMPVRRSKAFSDRFILFKQLRALFLKDLTLQSRAIGTNVCQLLTPIIFISFAGLMQVILNIVLKEHGTAIPGSSSLLFPIDITRSLACVTDGNSSNPDFRRVDGTPFGLGEFNITNCRDNFLNFFVEHPGIEELIEGIFPNYTNETLELDIFTLARPQDLLFDLPMFYVGKADGVDIDLGELSYTGDRAGFIGGAVPQEFCYNFSTSFTIDPLWPLQRNISRNYTNDEGPFISVPFFLPIQNLSTLNTRLDQVVKAYNNEAQTASGYYDNYERIYVVTPLSHNQYNKTLRRIQEATAEQNETKFEQLRPSGALFINSFNTSSASVSVSYTIVANELALYYPYNPYSDEFSEALDIHQRNNLINMMHNAIFKDLTGLDPEDPVAIATSIMPLPAPPRNLTLDISSILGGILYPYATSFLLPVYIAVLVKDKSEKHLIMMEQNGMSRWTYWTVTYIFNFMLYSVIAIIISLLSLAFQIRLFTQTNALVLILSLFLWGNAQIAMGFFFSNFFTSPRAATIIGYLLVFASVAVALLLELLKIFPDDKTPFAVYMFYPPFAFYRLLFYLINACLGYSCYSIAVFDPTQGLNLVTTAMLYIGVDTIVILLVSMYLSYVLPGDYGVRKSPFFPIMALYRGCTYMVSGICRLGGHTLELESDITMTQPPVDPPVPTAEFVDEDVIAEHELLSQGFPPEAPVVMYQLRKEYPGSSGAPTHVAVHSVSVAIQRNECFGLLGPNGAGKTTLISVLTGLYEPTRGTARIAGYDITTEISSIHKHLGVCPQFDIHHADLSAEEHLLFYARLKGVVWRKEKEVVKTALRQVNLYDARKRKSKALSGGMRRRLSIAMAIIGQPDILILDEPTTGLDPASRRQVWEVLEKVKEGRSVILTTHAMEEADHLCTRIGIMNYGRLRCLGTQTRLKAKFGSGYQLQFHCEKGRSHEVEEFVQAQLPKAVHMETYADLVSFKLERADLVVSQLFQQFNSSSARVGILDWGIKMTTLEDGETKLK
jgi:ABC-type multidrug transport system ATPase subunit